MKLSGVIFLGVRFELIYKEHLVGSDNLPVEHIAERLRRETIKYTSLLKIKSNLFAQIYHINIGSSKSVHEQGQQGWKQH